MWWYLLWLLVICNGNTAAGVAIINRLHGYRLPEWVIHLSHKIHYLLLLAVPLATLISTGLFGPRLLRGGSWQELPPVWWSAFAVCVPSSLIFWGSVIRRHLRRDPAQQIRTASRRLDIARELGVPPVGTGPYRWMTRLPGNELFELEIAEREFVVPQLAPAWDGLTILHFSDAHFIGTVGRAYFERVLEHAQSLSPDLVCFTGDLLDDLSLVSWLPTTLGRLRATLGCCFILGNHDAWLDMDVIRVALRELGWHDVAASRMILQREGQNLAVAGSEFPWSEHQPTFQDVPAPDLRILLSHTPDNLQQARRENVDLMLSGHVHGGQIRLPLLGPIYCPSRFGCYYASGVFFEAPTLLHVSRGLSGRHPLRLGCPPEITRLVLRSPQR